ncbi:MAG: hypothetical protein ACREHD_22870, partial [Pirellulales bacterium]
SMDLPINTAAVDYRISRIVGHWNGEDLQEKPVRAKGKEVPEPPESNWASRRWLLLANLIVLLAVAAFLWLRGRRRPRAP